MPDAKPTRLTIDPPIASWQLGADRDLQIRAQLALILDTLGLHDTRFDPAQPIIATGHQAWFWHAGILAKNLAMSVACDRLKAQPIHLVVDHIANPALSIEVPIRIGDALTVKTLRLGSKNLSLGTGQRPPLDASQMRSAIEQFERDVEGEIAVDLSPLRDAAVEGEHMGSLADSITAMQLRWMQPMCKDVFVLRTSQLARLSAFQSLADRMLSDAPRCVACYNHAVANVPGPGAGVAPLVVERDRVELPLWVMDASGLGKVFADLADSEPLLTREDGAPIERIASSEPLGQAYYPLAPKALTLTGFMRSTMCDLFIHGIGGKHYEQVTQHWWQHWMGSALAPLTIVSADVTLDMDAPIATQQELDHAVWLAHHLPHNIDRFVPEADALDARLVLEKKRITQGRSKMHGKLARVTARHRLVLINRIFAAQFPERIAQANAAVTTARQGVANASIAARRDWCFSLNSTEKIAQLQEKIAGFA